MKKPSRTSKKTSAAIKSAPVKKVAAAKAAVRNKPAALAGKPGFIPARPIAAAGSRQHVIVGNCIAAVSAAEALRRLNPHDRIVILGDEAVPSYSRCLITYFLGGMVDKKHLLSHPEKWYKDLSIDLQLSTRAVGVDAKERIVMTEQSGRAK
ncbi:MAG: FAD-dependent oxidoreductase, partial [Pseudomonadota bacterium]